MTSAKEQFEKELKDASWDLGHTGQMCIYSHNRGYRAALSSSVVRELESQLKMRDCILGMPDVKHSANFKCRKCEALSNLAEIRDENKQGEKK